MASNEGHNTATQPSSSNGGDNAAAKQHQNADNFVDAVTAAMPPSMEEMRSKTADELLAEMNRIPLFMTTLDETDGEGGENVMLEAIKALAYEGTKAEVAANFREQGNEAARSRLWNDAREFYTKAIASVQGKIKLVDAPEDAHSSARITEVTDEDPTIKVTELDEEAEAIKEREIEEACLANRALCNLEMKNYGQVNKDCAAVLRLNPRNIKAWYRAASACLALDKVPEALDACTSGLQFDASNAALRTLQGKVESRRDYLAALARERQQREERQRVEQAALRTAFKARNIVTRETASPPEMEDAAIQLEDAKDPASTLSFPVLFMYPLHAQTDFVKAFQENEALTDHLSYLLPVPWDEAKEYGTVDAIECYMETSQGGLIKAGKKLNLIKLLGSGKVEIVDGLVRIYIVPKARSAEWIEQFKARRGKQ
ncbi:Putative tetratricopeptide-like helical domain superfamily, cns1/TTC4, wheel [Septoria linicola]|uniref:Tetratricopeptide-like helical domain superfamily, cns1/TTC4, wheel n=1 Tax=Septoria linicola TaxID=215465 RepID=A0A9Q9B2Q8_9PEZI|nr:Putative tetratricopeptide-like helical domain superfamily, cns1/TTC4, wheel [Septoria linicola]